MTGVSVLLVAFALLGAPLFAVIAASALAGFASSDIDLAAVPIEFYRIADTPVLSALPLFTLAGYLLGETNAPQRLVRLSEAFLGWLPGGLAIVTVASCALFTAFTGASGITIVALGALLYPAMRYAGYEERFSLGLLTSSGSLGVLFAPSLPIILYGVISQRLGVGRPVSIEELFVAGVLPGLLMAVMLAGWSAWRNRALRTRSDTFSWAAGRAALRESAWELPLPFLVLGGIYSGWLAVSEVAAVTVIYVLAVEVLVLREIPLRRLPDIMRRSMVLFGAVLVILGMALALDELPRRRGGAGEAVRRGAQPHHEPAHVLARAERIPARARHDPRHLLGDRHRRSAPPADGGGLRGGSGAPGDHLPRQHADRLLHAAGGDESLHREPPLREAGAGAVPRGGCRSSSSCSPPCSSSPTGRRSRSA